MSFPRYEAYKDSGIEWLEEVPKDWRSMPIKHVGWLKGGAGFPHDAQGVEGESLDYHKVNALSRADAGGYLSQSDNTIAPDTAKRLGAFVFPPETIVFAKVGAALLLARIRVIRKDSCIDNNMMGLIVYHEFFDISFVRYALELVRFDLIANPGAVPSLNEGQIGNFRLPIPSNRSEQHAIASFLDRETSKIDTLVSEQRRLVELLKEKRQAVISHAVTKGLDPTVPMKPSGIEWLGDVPKHWEVEMLARVTTKIGNGFVGPTRDILVESGVPYIQATHIKNGRVNFDGAYFVTPEWAEWQSKAALQLDDVLVVQTGAGTGDIGLVSAEEVGYRCHALIIVRTVKSRLLGSYLSTVLQSHYGRQTLASIQTGGMHPHLNCGNVKFVYAPIPSSTEEQAGIVAFVDNQSNKIDSLIAEAERAITLLQERRTALISAAVTGKIDVRNASRGGAGIAEVLNAGS